MVLAIIDARIAKDEKNEEEKTRKFGENARGGVVALQRLATRKLVSRTLQLALKGTYVGPVCGYLGSIKGTWEVYKVMEAMLEKLRRQTT